MSPSEVKVFFMEVLATLQAIQATQEAILAALVERPSVSTLEPKGKPGRPSKKAAESFKDEAVEVAI
jgi:hypothetical protein